MPSPMLAVNSDPVQVADPEEQIEVEVWVDQVEGEPLAVPGWFDGMLAQWARYEDLGWTGWVRFRVASSQNYVGRFAAEHIRKAEGPGP